jgi:hypothetical protein
MKKAAVKESLTTASINNIYFLRPQGNRRLPSSNSQTYTATRIQNQQILIRRLPTASYGQTVIFIPLL